MGAALNFTNHPNADVSAPAMSRAITHLTYSEYAYLSTLLDEPRSVGAMRVCDDWRVINPSAHMQNMRRKGLCERRGGGRSVVWFLTDAGLNAVVDVMVGNLPRLDRRTAAVASREVPLSEIGRISSQARATANRKARERMAQGARLRARADKFTAAGFAPLPGQPR